MTFPLVVSFYTTGTPYETEITRLLRSCERFGLETHIRAVESKGRWVENCAMKGPFISECLESFQRPLLWLDADAQVVRYPQLFDNASFDVGAYQNAGKLLSGTLYFAPTEGAISLARDWARLCIARPRKWDQRLLAQALHVSNSTVSFQCLPQGYCKIFDRAWRPGEDPTEYIVHYQASRRSKQAIRRLSHTRRSIR